MDMVLSDVHASHTNKPTAWKDDLSITRFSFELTGLHSCADSRNSTDDNDDDDEPCFKKSKTEDCNSCRDSESQCLQYDGDGDLNVARRPKICHDIHYITIFHKLCTDIDGVGQQVWNGALLMCDFLIYRRDIFTNSKICDLGSGIGLTSIIAGIFAQTVFLTDSGNEVLNLAYRNVQHNMSTLLFDHDLVERRTLEKMNIIVKELDWFSKNIFDIGYTGKYGLTEDDIKLLKTSEFLLAADVVYDDDITDAFFRTVHSLMSVRPARTLYISLEKRRSKEFLYAWETYFRIVFTTKDLDVSSPAYQHFKECLSDLVLLNEENGVTYQYRQIQADFPQFFQYKRLKEMELWEITSKFPD